MSEDGKHWILNGEKQWVVNGRSADVMTVFAKTQLEGSDGKSVEKVKKLNRPYPRGVTPKRVTNGGVHLHGLARGQHSCEETSQLSRAAGDTLSDFTGPGIELGTPELIEMCSTTTLSSRYPVMSTSNMSFLVGY